jgi:acyl carrier protein
MEIKTEVRQYVVKNFLGSGQYPDLDDATPLVTGGIIDSIGMIGLIGFIEARFGIEFLPREVDLHNLDTVERIERLVLNKLAAGASSGGPNQEGRNA